MEDLIGFVRAAFARHFSFNLDFEKTNRTPIHHVDAASFSVSFDPAPVYMEDDLRLFSANASTISFLFLASDWLYSTRTAQPDREITL